MDVQGIERMKASGRLAADVLEYAGTLVQVRPPCCNLDNLIVKVPRFIFEAGAEHFSAHDAGWSDDR